MARQHPQRGQSLVEVVVLATALVPLLLAIPLLAKYQDVRHAAIAASRTAAFECSVRPDDCPVASEQAAMLEDLRHRHFGRHDRDLLSADAMAEELPPEQRNRFWVDRHGSSLLAATSDLSLDLVARESDAARGAWANESSGATRSDAGRFQPFAAGPRAFGFDLEKGLVAARVLARVSLHRTLEQWLDKPQGIALALAGKTAVMVDAWNASSSGGSEARSFHARVEQGRRLPSPGEAVAMFAEAARLAPAGSVVPDSASGAEEAIDRLYTPIRSLITGPLMAPLEPRGSLFRYHEIDVDVVPADRLEAP
jgi:hypothetical protein